MIKVGDVIWNDTYSNDRSGFFVVEEESSPGRFKCRRVMKRDGTVIKKTKMREYFDSNTKPVTPEDIRARFEDAVKCAENEFNYLKQYVK